MDSSISSSGTVDNVIAQNYLEELLDKVVTLKASVSEKEYEKTTVSDELDSLANKIQQTIVTTSELKSKHILPSKHIIGDGNKDGTNEKSNFKEQFNQLQQILGITFLCSPEKKLFEITFNDVQQSRVSFTYNGKGIEIVDMHPIHHNFDAIRENLRETGDLLGFLTVFGKRLTKATPTEHPTIAGNMHTSKEL